MHGHRIDQDDFVVQVWVLFLHDFAADATPQSGHFQDIGFVDHRELLAASPRRIGGHSDNALDFMGGVDCGAVSSLLAVGEGLAARGSEIQSTGQFAEEQDVGAFDDRSLQRRGIEQFGERDNGP